MTAEGLRRETGHMARCAMGVFNIKVAMPCADDGITDGVWYALPSDPADFGICGRVLRRHRGVPRRVALYSLRMRAIYAECGGGCDSADPAPLLEYSAPPPRVFVDTVLPCRMILFQQRVALEK
ncbi:hypothetical protein F5X99DRAFT_382954 [Biscogniauxia marginata]|nr:hypothetical protein F5X99DRAFT_382954 [Biscogniauxia marginata]